MSADELAGWADAIEDALERSDPPRAIQRVAVVRETGSTQDAARRLSGGEPGLVVVAGRQVDGRGRLGRSWSDAGDHTIAMTCALSAGAHPPSFVSLAGGLAACVAAERAVGQRLGLRWPNDVVERAEGRKLAGVLVEQTGDLLFLGVGMNVSQRAEDWPDDLRPIARSLAECGSDISRLGAACLLIEAINETLTASPAELAAMWSERDVLLGARRAFIAGGRRVEGTVEAIDPSEGLLVRTDAGVIEPLDARTTSLVHPQ